MADNTAIEWAGATWSPVLGCTRVDPACAHCYVERQPPLRTRRMRFHQEGNESTTGIVLVPERLDAAKVAKLQPRDKPIFVCSLSDLFHEAVPDDFLREVFWIMRRVEERTFQVLTKRPKRAASFIADYMRRHELVEPLPNVWVGTTIANARYTWRADVLREIPAAVRFISAEPLLGSLFESHTPVGSARPGHNHKRPLSLEAIDWLIAGGESGGRFARPMHPDWARELRDACVESGTTFFMKQWGSYAPDGANAGDFKYLGYDGRWHGRMGLDADPDALVEPVYSMRWCGASPRSGGRLLDGREWNEMPQLPVAVAGSLS